MFSCEKCLKSFTTLQNLAKHQNKKNSCEEKNLTCQYCNQFFGCNSHLKRHQLQCVNKLLPTTVTTDNSQQHHNTSTNTSSHNTTVSPTIDTSTVTTSNIGNHNTINIYNYNLAPVGKEYQQFIEPEKIITILKNDTIPIDRYFDLLKMYQPNQNAYLTDASRSKCMVYKEVDTDDNGKTNQWNMQNKRRTAKEIYDSIKEQAIAQLNLYLKYGWIDQMEYKEMLLKLNNENLKDSLDKIIEKMYNQRETVQKIKQNNDVVSYETEPQTYPLETYLLPWHPEKDKFYDFEKPIQIYFKHFLTIKQKLELIDRIATEEISEQWILDILKNTFFDPSRPEFHCIYYKKGLLAKQSELEELQRNCEQLPDDNEIGMFFGWKISKYNMLYNSWILLYIVGLIENLKDHIMNELNKIISTHQKSTRTLSQNLTKSFNLLSTNYTNFLEFLHTSCEGLVYPDHFHRALQAMTTTMT